MNGKKLLSTIIEFDWDEHNRTKNWRKHQVSLREVEEVFFDKQLIVRKDMMHSSNESRYLIIGMTMMKRLLFVVFTLRQNKIRVISARDMKKGKEVKIYEKTT